ncbi:AAA family ATPase [Pseudomonas batumici]|uniref:AAA family ATPase n=1 Tax=Pseudomonas batumici TaxID=226910 RepID=UPI0030D13BE1
MKLTLLRPYKSLKTFEDIELPDFTIITGTNGAGKSQLLKALDEGALSIEGIAHSPHNRLIRLFDATTLVPTDTGAFVSFQSKQERDGIWNHISSLINSARVGVEAYMLQWSELSKLDLKKLAILEPSDLPSYGIQPDQVEAVHKNIKSNLAANSQNIASQFSSNNPAINSKLIEKITASCGIPIVAFDMDLFYEHYPMAWQPVELFQQSFARLFSEYQATFVANEVKAYRRDIRGANVPVLTKEEFFEKYGSPPWDFLNDILEAASLSFRINQPDEFEERPYEPILTDLVTNAQVKFNDLSSGERILMSFALCLYYTRDSGDRVNYPLILLFDEVDAPLHPSMTKSLLDTIQKVLIGERKIKVIMTTHSPSTVALCPEEAIFIMTKEGRGRLKKTNKDSALSLLMSGVPSISISYENRRQVFVESHLDVQYYDHILRKIKSRLHPAVSLSFIASSDSKIGGCVHVKDIVGQLSKHGNPTIRGLIDWDTTNQPSDKIVVLGHNFRYSIENYILDPLLVAMLLFQDKSVERSELGLGEHEGSADILKMAQPRLQRIVDYIVDTVSCGASDAESVKIKCEYLGGQFVLLPKPFMLMQGHGFEDLLKSKFEGLKRYHRTNDLKATILKRVVDEFPSLIPLCLLEAFRELQEPI